MFASVIGQIGHPFYVAFAWLLAFYYSLIPNYAVAIALLTLSVMIVTYPITLRGTRGMMKMQLLAPELKKSQAKFKEKQKLNFPLLSDPDFSVIEAYDARRMKSFLGKSYLGIVRSTVLIGPDGKVEKIWPAAKAKGHAAEIVEALKALQ